MVGPALPVRVAPGWDSRGDVSRNARLRQLQVHAEKLLQRLPDDHGDIEMGKAPPGCGEFRARVPFPDRTEVWDMRADGSWRWTSTAFRQ